MKTWTVLGVWHQDEPYPVGAVEGDQVVYGGDAVHDGMTPFQGPWAQTVQAEDSDKAEALAVDLMLATLDKEDS